MIRVRRCECIKDITKMGEMPEDERFMMPGKIYDVVRDHEDVSFDTARHLIQKSKVKVIESSGNVFRNIIPRLSETDAHKILQQSYSNTNKQNLKLTCLTKINTEGLYESSSKPFYGSASESLNRIGYTMPDTLVELECFYESIIKSLGDCQTTIQGFNLSVNPPSKLQSFPYHTSPKMNPRLEAKNGINVPVFRIGTRASFEEMHKTFGLLDRVDVLHWGAPRLWLVVQLNFHRALELRLSSLLTRRGVHPPWCPRPTYHKEFMVFPSLLRKWSIPFEIIVQMPGDLVHLRDWVPQQVIDLGTNISETVSVGSTEWNMTAKTTAFLNCPCGTKFNVGDNNFGGNELIYARVELMVPRSRLMPCTHVSRAIEDAKREYKDADGVIYKRFLPKDYDRVPVLKEYRMSLFTRCGSNKCYGCGKRSEDLKSHLSRHIMCRAKLNLVSEDDDNGEEPVTDESDEELDCNDDVKETNYEAKIHCAFCRMPFEVRRLLNAHVEKVHRKKFEAKRRVNEEMGLVTKTKRKKYNVA